LFKHTLVLIYRSFKRFKGTFLINLVGLSTGLACTLLIYLWANDELQKDNFFEKDDQLFQVMENRVQAQGIWTAQSTSGVMAELLVKEMPEVEFSAHTTWSEEVTLSVGENDVRARGNFVGVDYFNIFSYEVIQGDRRKVLADKNSIVISEDLAMKLFNTTENALGKSIIHQRDHEYIVTGIMKIPENSSLQVDFVLSFDRYVEIRGKDNFSWRSTHPFAFVLLKKGTDVDQFNKKIADYVRTKTNNEVTHRTLFVTPYSKAYLYGKYENGVQAGGRITYVKLFSIIAIFILVIACINFMNLSTAKASGRIKEVGIKKAIGAQRKTLVVQYLGESLLLTFISLGFALVLVQLCLPQFNEITEKELSMDLGLNVILFFMGISLFTGIIAGSYPALYLSHFNPAAVLKGKISSGIGEVWARKGLVVFQFALSVIFIVLVLVIYKQIEFVQNKDLGYNRDNVISIKMEGKARENRETFLSEIRNIPGIISASSTGSNLTGHNSGTYGVEWEGKNPEDKTEFENIAVDYDMMETLGVELVDGRAFSRGFASDSSKIIFNEAGIKFMGLTEPVGKTIKLWGEEREIIGVVKDFHFESLHKSVGPLFFRLEPSSTYLFMAKIEAGKEKETIERLQTFYQKFSPDFTLDYKFMDEQYRAQYAAEERISILSRYFAGLAVLISCLGLFGLAAFSAERRLKEIGIRKALGASVSGIIYLLTGDFTKIVFISIVFALPLSYFLTKNWLESFAFKIELEIWYFLGAGIIALFIAGLTVSMQAIKAASVNPSKCLRDE
jgi:putative ABC transport system permease protein